MKIAQWTILAAVMLGPSACGNILAGLGGPGYTGPPNKPCASVTAEVEGITYTIERAERLAPNRLLVIVRQANHSEETRTIRPLSSAVRERYQNVSPSFRGSDLQAVGGGRLELPPEGRLAPGRVIVGQIVFDAPVDENRLSLSVLGEPRAVGVLSCPLGRI